MIDKLERYLPPALVTLTFVISYLYLYFGAMPLYNDLDFFWHMAAGNLILDQGKIPAVDPWSFSAGAQPWYIISWSWDVLLALVGRAAGLEGVFVCAVLLMALNLAFLAYSLCRRSLVKSDALILTLFIAGLCFIEFTSPRPQLVGYFCVLWFHFVLHQSRTGISFGKWLTLPLFMLVWLNTHGSFIAGFTLLGAYGLEAIWQRRWQWFRQLLVAGALCLAVVPINPYGIHIYDAVMSTLGSVIVSHIIEWLPFVFGNSVSISVWFLMFILLGVMRDKDVPIADKILSLAWFLAMLFSIRNAAIFILVSAPALAICLQRVSEQLASIRTVRPDLGLALQAPGMRHRAVIAASIVLAGSIGLINTLKGESAVSAGDYITPAIQYLDTHARGKRILNEFNFGSRILYETQGRVPIFVDARCGTAYSEDVLKEALAFMQMEDGWDDILAKYRIDGIIVNHKNLFNMAYENGRYRDQWNRVYHDEVATIYMRKR
jgi:hypothetical protein